MVYGGGLSAERAFIMDIQSKVNEMDREIKAMAQEIQEIKRIVQTILGSM
jgi:hypothetical protein